MCYVTSGYPWITWAQVGLVELVELDELWTGINREMTDMKHTLHFHVCFVVCSLGMGNPHPHAITTMWVVVGKEGISNKSYIFVNFII